MKLGKLVEVELLTVSVLIWSPEGFDIYLCSLQDNFRRHHESRCRDVVNAAEQI